MADESEEWRDVVGYSEIYQVSDMGRVRSKPRRGRHWRGGTRSIPAKILKPFDGRGYLRVSVRVPGEKQHFRSIHRLVCEAFIGTIPNNMQVNHKDGNKHNNAASNLEIVTGRENMIHASSLGLLNTAIGERQGHSKLTERDVCVIRSALSRNLTLQKIADVFGVNPSTVHDILSGRSWSHVQ